MIRKRRILAFLFLTIFLVDLFSPIASFALTSGPTAPEATSFEPVDTTDMVNLLSGDFAYSMPLIEVPGPSGSYPLSLSYHAGIQVNEDASWVGLGWTLNPGAISRSVSGFPDDYSAVPGLNRTFWEGGESSSAHLGVNLSSLGIPADFSLSYSADTYRGFSHSAALGYGRFGMTWSNSSLNGSNVSFTGSINLPWGSITSDGKGGGTFNTPWVHGSLTNGQVSADLNLANGSSSSTGASLKSFIGMASKKSLGVAIWGEVHNSRSGKLSTNGYDFSLDVGFAQLGASYHRYWIDETESADTYGSLYLPQQALTNVDGKAFDTYDLPGLSQNSENGSIDLSNADSDAGNGTFIDYDHYNVSAQGLGGNFRPYHYRSSLYRQTRYETDGSTVKVKTLPLANNLPADFRFVGDFSNRFISSGQSLPYNSTESMHVVYPTGSRKTGENDTDGYNDETNALFGSRKIEWNTNSGFNSAVSETNRGFLMCTAPGFTRASDTRVGGFRIKNESGVTYHFSLPAYAYDEYRYSGRKDEAGKYYFNTTKTAGKYAYVWYLTAVTGPDYIDRNANREVDEDDWGYWVSFEYGLCASAYRWRNPSEGFTKDIDREFSVFSKGKKEVYYLNKIKTATHTAIFVKDIRKDAKGGTSEYDEAVRTFDYYGITVPLVTYLDSGSFEVIGNSRPQSLMRLSKIYILKNGSVSLAGLEAAGPTDDDLLLDNLIDVYDIQTSMINATLRSVELIHDYSLVDGTSNSFLTEDEISISGQPNGQLGVKSGKLTLKSISVFGKQGASVIPPTQFGYDLSSDERHVVPVASIDSESFPESADQVKTINLSESSPLYLNLDVGDLLKFDQNQVTHFARVKKKLADEIQIVPIKTMPQGSNIYNLSKTKNPAYFPDNYDAWGLFKSDYDPWVVSETANRTTSEISAKSVDVWSLREIKLPVGSSIKVRYEADKYTNAIRRFNTLEVKSIEPLETADRVRVNFYRNISDIDIQEGLSYSINAIFRSRWTSQSPTYTVQCNGVPQPTMYAWSPTPLGHVAVVQHKDSYSIDVEDHFIYERLTKVPSPTNMEHFNPSTLKIASDPYYVPYFFQENNLMGAYMPLEAEQLPNWGGGIRVDSLKLISSGTERTTHYEYEGGITAYEPGGLESYVGRLPATICTTIKNIELEEVQAFKNRYNELVSGTYKDLFVMARELPSPGVNYGKVTVTESISRNDDVLDVPGSTEYYFEVFEPNLVDPAGGPAMLTFSWADVLTGHPAVSGLSVTGVSYAAATVENHSSRIGNIKRVVNLDGQGKTVREKKYNYLHDEGDNSDYVTNISQNYKNQGVIHETFADARVYRTTLSTYRLLGMVSHRTEYPSILTGVVTTDYRTGLQQETKTLSFDFYSGLPSATYSKDGFGNHWVTETTPAYKFYNGMGPSGKNMLAQEGKSMVFKIDGPAVPGASYARTRLVSAVAQTWSDQVPVLDQGTQAGIWRKHRVFEYVGTPSTAMDGDGLMTITNTTIPPFSAWNYSAVAEAGWQKTSEITLYDWHSNALEALDINGTFAATKLSYDKTRVFSSAVNSKYSEFAYSGAEEIMFPPATVGGGVVVHGAQLSSPHTGKYGIQAIAANPAFSYTITNPEVGKTFVLSVWSTLSTANLTSTKNNEAPLSITVKTVGQSGNWYLLEGQVTALSGTTGLTLTCSAAGSTTVFDDFRVSPANSSMTSFVFNEWGELSHTLDAFNLYTEFNYDNMGRLIKTFKETFFADGGQPRYGNQAKVKVSEIEYNFGAPYTVPITAIRTGTSGMIYPSGVNVSQGGTQHFQIVETCQTNKLLKFLIDGVEINLAQTSQTLPDGTALLISGGGYFISLSNVQSKHTLQAQFVTAAAGSGGVQCSVVGTCNTGRYNYYLIDGCGVQHWTYNVLFQNIPASIRPTTQPNCCQDVDPNCGCANVQY